MRNIDGFKIGDRVWAYVGNGVKAAHVREFGQRGQRVGRLAVHVINEPDERLRWVSPGEVSRRECRP